MAGPLAVRALGPADGPAAVAVVNAAAAWYRTFLPPAEVHDPEMTPEAWSAEARRLTWHGAFAGDALVGVMGLERVGGVALLRHAYVRPEEQRRGVGTRLREHLEAIAAAQGAERIVVGTYAGNYKARRALEKAGYRLSPDPAAVLRAYYEIPAERRRASVTYEKLLPAAPAGAGPSPARA
jgi:GNAT superfamily N-acetyltransferase